MVDRLHIVQVFQHIQQFLHLGHVFRTQLNRVFGAHGDFSNFGLEVHRLQRQPHGLEISRGRQYLDGTIAVHQHIIGARLQRHLHQLVFAGTGCKNQLTAVFELERHRTLGAHIATVLAERVPDFGHGTDPVVGHGVHDDGRTRYAVALVADFFVVHTFLVAGRLVDVAFDGLRRHIRGLGFFHRQPQSRVDAEVTAALARRHHDFTDNPGPHLASFFVLPTLAVLNIGPFAVSCHAKSFKNSLP